jgi:hypothetical protein
VGVAAQSQERSSCPERSPLILRMVKIEHSSSPCRSPIPACSWPPGLARAVAPGRADPGHGRGALLRHGRQPAPGLPSTAEPPHPGPPLVTRPALKGFTLASWPPAPRSSWGPGALMNPLCLKLSIPAPGLVGLLFPDQASPGCAYDPGFVRGLAPIAGWISLKPEFAWTWLLLAAAVDPLGGRVRHPLRHPGRGLRPGRGHPVRAGALRTAVGPAPGRVRAPGGRGPVPPRRGHGRPALALFPGGGVGRLRAVGRAPAHLAPGSLAGESGLLHRQRLRGHPAFRGRAPGAREGQA